MFSYLERSGEQGIKYNLCNLLLCNELSMEPAHVSQELSDQLRAVRRTVFILTSSRKCYVENLVLPHIKLCVAGNLDLALHDTTQDRFLGKFDFGGVLLYIFRFCSGPR